MVGDCRVSAHNARIEFRIKRFLEWDPATLVNPFLRLARLPDQAKLRQVDAEAMAAAQLEDAPMVPASHEMVPLNARA
jgi:hypothetical protein